MEVTISDDEKGILQRRQKLLACGICVIKVGGATESEILERYDRVDDALNAVRVAIKDGVVPGGGIALVRAADALSKQKHQSNLASLLIRALQEPMKQIMRNSGYSPDIIAEKAKNSDATVGFDARNGEWGDMFEMGVIDPTKVVISAFENALSSALMLATAGCTIIEEFAE